jgi:hypothetical protein
MLKKWLDKQVIVEGTFPVPLPSGGIAYGPSKGKLVAVFEDGFEIEHDEGDRTFYVLANIRSVTVWRNSKVVGVQNKIVTA